MEGFLKRGARTWQYRWGEGNCETGNVHGVGVEGQSRRSSIKKIDYNQGTSGKPYGNLPL